MRHEYPAWNEITRVIYHVLKALQPLLFRPPDIPIPRRQMPGGGAPRKQCYRLQAGKCYEFEGFPNRVGHILPTYSLKK